MAENEGRFRRLLGEGRRELIAEGFRQLWFAAVPLGWAALTAVLSYAQRLPLAYASAVVAFVFASAGVGTYQFHNLVYLRTPKGKLRFTQVLLAAQKYISTGDKIGGIIIGVDFNSIAIFPMQARLVEVKTIVGGHITTRRRNFPVVNVDAAGMGYFYDIPVEITGLDISKVIDGEFSFDIAYGRRGSFRYHLRGDYKLYIKFKSPEEIEHFRFNQA